jgi:glyoxylase-like metal-dependent hydrolase (beta-lactamase superfamily II)
MVEKLFSNLDDKSTVYRSTSNLFSVCTYFIVDSKKILIIDPGQLSKEVYIWLEQFENLKKIIYLTHEHFDHHFDVNKLLEHKNTFLYNFSDSFKKAISNSKTNLSYYYNTPISTISNHTTDVNFFEVIKTPGHSKLSVCLLYKNILFGGDSIIEKKYLVLKLPGSNKVDYKESVNKVKLKMHKNTIVLPGHGSTFCFDLWKM